MPATPECNSQESLQKNTPLQTPPLWLFQASPNVKSETRAFARILRLRPVFRPNWTCLSLPTDVTFWKRNHPDEPQNLIWHCV